MLLTTYQSEEAYRAILAGTYRPALAKSHVALDERFARAYAWLKAQMRLRVGNEPAGVATPYWAWLFRKDAPLERYDEDYSGCMKITLEIDESRVLVSSYDDWHCVLNDWPVLLPEEYDQDDEARDELLRRYYPIRQKTWPRIFDMKNYPESWAFQVTFWRLFPDDIISVARV